MSYQEAYSYYLYNVIRGYEPIKPEKKSFLSKFDTPDQKLVRKMLQQNKISVNDENSLVKGWNLVKESGVAVHF